MCLIDIKKIKAFTLLELSVVMVVSGLVFALSFSAYTIVSKQYEKFKSANERMLNVSTVYAVLTRDFSDAVTIRKSGDELILRKTDGNEIIYAFEPGRLLRKVNDTEDSFVNIFNDKIFFLGTEQMESNGLVDELYCEAGKEAYPLRVKKFYAADVLMLAEEESSW